MDLLIATAACDAVFHRPWRTNRCDLRGPEERRICRSLRRRRRPTYRPQLSNLLAVSRYIPLRSAPGRFLATHKSSRYMISYWDAAILAAPEALGAQTLFSEDLSDGQQYGGVRVVNPFS